jgi:hypothetical protein
MSFQSEGSGEDSRALHLRDASKSNAGIPESSELGSFKSLVVGYVDTVVNALITAERQARLQPRNWHYSEAPPPLANLPNVKDQRASVCLIADHEHDFPGWALDKGEKSPHLDDWFYDAAANAIQKSTRIVDYLDPKGRTALLAQLVKVIDDHLGEYTTAIVMGRNVGNHEVAAAGYVWDNDKNFNGLLDTFFETRHADAQGAGREGTPYGILSERTDAHFDWPNMPEHGRIKFQRIDLSGVPEGIVKYKCTLGFDPSVANQDSEIQKESGQWRPWYHCVDKPERPLRPTAPGPVPIPASAGAVAQPPPTAETVTTRVGPPPAPAVVPAPAVPPAPVDPVMEAEFERIQGLLAAEDKARRASPAAGGEGRIISLPLASDPPWRDGLNDVTQGSLSISEEADGTRALWIDSRRTAAPQLGNFWERVLTVPKGVPTGKMMLTDGKGGWTWVDPPSTAAPKAGS